MEDDEQRSVTVEDNEQRSATVEDNEQRPATALGQVELQIGEQRFKLASFNRRALLQIGIAFFFVTGKERERDSDRKKRERERGAKTIILKCRERGRE